MAIHQYSAHILLLNKDQKFLLLQRKDVAMWVIPGGRSELGEKPEETAVREFWEETGVKILKSTIKLVVHYIPQENKYRHKYLFVCKTNAEIRPRLTNESQALGFYSLNTLPFPVSMYEKSRIQDALSAINDKKVIEKKDDIDWKAELRQGLKTPLAFFNLLIHYSILSIKRNRT